MHILLDTNIVLDVLLNRAPWVTEAKAIWQANDEGEIIGYITATTLTNIFYVARRLAGLEIATQAIRTCLDAFEICPVERQTLELAVSLTGQDFEDNLQVACATLAGLEAIVTRNVADFKNVPLPILTPVEALTRLGQERVS